MRTPKPGSVAWTNTRIADLEAVAVPTADEQRELQTLRGARAERRATRRTQFERERAPLLAEQIPATAPESYLLADEANRQSWIELQERHRRSAEARRLEVLAAVSAETLAAMDARWTKFQGPHTPTYEAGYWLERYRETFHKNPPDAGYVITDAEGARYVYGAPWPRPDADRWKLDPAEIDALKQRKSPALFGGE